MRNIVVVNFIILIIISPFWFLFFFHKRIYATLVGLVYVEGSRKRLNGSLGIDGFNFITTLPSHRSCNARYGHNRHIQISLFSSMHTVA
uniref:Putative secreted peptide n=1 Tax=Anopheles braziliensis TaxID=58242 RepID=A0A2M3ZPM8_9DIPT